MCEPESFRKARADAVPDSQRAAFHVPRFLRPVLIVYVVVGVTLWPVPLLNVLHAESSAVVATVAFFAAGLTSLRAFARGWTLRRVLATQEAALAVPWALLTVTALWAPNCGYLFGLLFFALFPGVTVVLAVALAFLLSVTRMQRRKTVLVLVGLAILVLGPLYDLGLHPQFYTYNHVFGGILGPIYDEELAVRPGLFWFRGLTLLWAAFLVSIAPFVGGHGETARRREGERDKGREGEGRGAQPQSETNAPPASGVSRQVCDSPTLRFSVSPTLPLALALAIVVFYAFAAPLGINTPAWYLQRALGGHVRTEHFDLYYDPDSVEPQEVRRLALSHEYRYHWLAERLGVEVPERIASYLYPSAEVKARLVGARHTSVVPVWLPDPQSHVMLEHYDRVFGHELVHVFSRRFGLPVVNASLSVGLVEGLAEALEPPDGRPSLHEQVVAAALQEVGVRSDEAHPLADEVASRLSPFGFWTGRGAVSYTTMGSFVQYLIERYGAEHIRAVYAWGDFDAVYGRPLVELAREWEAHLFSLPVTSRDAAPLARARFSQPSLFEVRCPHHVPTYRRRYERAEEALAERDTQAAERHLDASLASWSTYPPALAAWARLQLAQGRPREVIQRLETVAVVDAVPALRVRLGDAYALAGLADSARAEYLRARRSVPLYAFDVRAQLVLREAVAVRPNVVRVLVGLDSADVKAERLARMQSRWPAVDALRGLLLAEAGRYADAASLLHDGLGDLARTLPGDERGLVLTQRLVWLADLAYRAGDVSRAQDYARSASGAFRQVGAFNVAERMAELADEMAWVAVRAGGDPLEQIVIY